MSFREKSAWATAAALILAYGWYVSTVASQLDGQPVSDVDYQGSAVLAAIAVVLLIAATNAVLAATGRSVSKEVDAATGAIKRYARSAGGAVVAAAAILGMALAMIEADYFWIANVVLVGLVVAEVAGAASEILVYRRGR